MRFLLIFSFFFYSALLPVSSATEKPTNTLNVGIVDTVRILAEYPKAQKVLQEISKAEELLSLKVKNKRKELEDARSKNKTDTEIQMLAEQFKLEIEPEAKKLETESARKSKEIEDEVKKTIEAIAKSSSYDVVLSKQAVLYGGTDISNTVLNKLNK
jgi:outer membrane protein